MQSDIAKTNEEALKLLLRRDKKMGQRDNNQKNA